VLRSWAKAWKEKDLGVTVMALVWQSLKDRLVEENLDFMGQVKRGAKKK